MNKSNNKGSKFGVIPEKNQRFKRFMRKPSEKSQKSISKKSLDSNNSINSGYIKTPTKTKTNEPNQFFKSLASSILTSSTEKKSTQRKKDESFSNGFRLNTLEAQMELKQHQAEVLSNQCSRYKQLYQQEKDRRRKLQSQKKEQIKELKRQIQRLRVENKKVYNEKEYLSKQIQFLQRISYDQKTLALQSYREKYLQERIEKLKTQIYKNKGQRQAQLQSELKTISQEKYTLQSHYKATKVANECLQKQLSQQNHNITQLVLHSQEYVKLREKYMKFLQQYKDMRTQYWALKSQIRGGKNDSSLLSMTVSDADDLTLLS